MRAEKRIQAKRAKLAPWKLSLWWGIVLMVFLPQAGVSGEGLTDAQKKEIIYRMYDNYRKDFQDVSEISPEEAMRLSREGRVLFVDVRKQEEMAVSMLPGAISEIEYLKDPAGYQDYTVVAYCTIGYRSGMFAKEMAQKGLSVHNLSGGILAWSHEGGKVYDGKAEIKRLHVYGKKWDYPPSGYESVKFGLFGTFFD